MRELTASWHSRLPFRLNRNPKTLGFAPSVTSADQFLSLIKLSVVRMHETGPTSRAQGRARDSELSPECDYKMPRDVYVTAITGPSLPHWTEGRPLAPQGPNHRRIES